MCTYPSAVRAIDCTGNSAVDKVIKGLDWVASNYQLPAVAQLSLGASTANDALDGALTVWSRISAPATACSPIYLCVCSCISWQAHSNIWNLICASECIAL